MFIGWCLFLQCNTDTIDKYDIRNFKLVDTSSSDTSKLRDIEEYVSISDTSLKMFKYYWPNGKLQSTSFFYNGLKEGKWESFFNDGQKFYIFNFVAGKQEGFQEIYHTNGVLSSKEEFRNGIKIGDGDYFDSSGNLIKFR
ncbi:hypothetical protein [Lacibacter sp.]|uniref:toxin-antitoxin system YwqK family antitoxin n=1 Tax=Lacibacter sp. TaxID=1915409 RepID=UPI002B4B5C91|nr:hypothetical protein [Lacibacter sp.]